jgi:predicted acylesterase/phospholipase RssA
VLGGGGILGAVYVIGTLAAMEKTSGARAHLFDIFVGTSAGSFVATGTWDSHGRFRWTESAHEPEPCLPP